MASVLPSQHVVLRIGSENYPLDFVAAAVATGSASASFFHSLKWVKHVAAFSQYPNRGNFRLISSVSNREIFFSMCKLTLPQQITFFPCSGILRTIKILFSALGK